jgi:hypothetical protein
LDGFSCVQNGVQNVCVPSTGGQGGAAVGQSGQGGAASGASNSGGAPNAGASNVGGTASGGGGGNGGVVSGGAAGEGGAGAQGGDDGEPDASAPMAGAGGCIPGPLYVDLDGDGHGSGAPQGEGCPSTGLSAENDDCFDAVPTGSNYAELVYPGQGDYFDFPYPAMGSPNGLSFDYDCSDEEEPDPNNDPMNEAPDCESLNDCTGQGWRPEPERPSGNGVLAICGVQVLITCLPENGSCAGELTLGPGGLRYLCH